MRRCRMEASKLVLMRQGFVVPRVIVIREGLRGLKNLMQMAILEGAECGAKPEDADS